MLSFTVMKAAAVRVLLLLIFLAGTASAQMRIANDPTLLSVGARTLGMGKTFAAVADDPSAIFLNPAGLGTAPNWELTSMSGKYINEVDYVQLAGILPTKFGTFGLGYGGMGISFRAAAPEVIIIGGQEKVFPSPTGEVSYQWSNTALLFSFGKNFVIRDLKDLYLGSSLKLYSQRLSGSNISPASASGLDLDIGGLYRPLKEMNVAAVLQNILPSGLGGGVKWDTGIHESLPVSAKLGLSYRLLGEEGRTQWKDQELAFSFDYEIFPTRSSASPISHVGVEWTPLEFASLRLGRDGNDQTYGIGITYDGYRFDYAYHTYSGLSSATTNYFSFSYGIFKKKKEIPSPPPVVKKVRKLISFVDVPAGYWAKEPIEELATLGIITGYPDGAFRPEGNITRAEMCTLLMKSKDQRSKIKTEELLFVDIPARHWAAGYIAQAVQRKIVTGYPDNTFRPQAPITRAEGVAVIARFADVKIGLTRLVEAPFLDVPGRHWAALEITAAREGGLLKYLEGKNFEPGRQLTRAEVAEILFRTSYVQSLLNY